MKCIDVPSFYREFVAAFFTLFRVMVSVLLVVTRLLSSRHINSLTVGKLIRVFLLLYIVDSPLII